MPKSPHRDLTATFARQSDPVCTLPSVPQTDTGSPHCLPGTDTSLPSHPEKPLSKRKLLSKQCPEMLLGDTIVLAGRDRVTESSTAQRLQRAGGPSVLRPPPHRRKQDSGPPADSMGTQAAQPSGLSVPLCGTGCSASLAVSHQR